MSEKVYAWLLRLYPARFREAYGAEALRLFRERSRDERGFIRAIRLWLDLLADLAISVPRQHRCAARMLGRASELERTDGVPSFLLLERESLPPGSLFAGAVLSLAAAALSISAGRVANYRPIPAADASAGALFASQAAFSDGPAVDASERRRVVDAAIANLKAHYIDPAVSQKMADTLLAHERAGDYNAITDGAAFAALLTRQLRDVSHDMHIEVVYIQRRLRSGRSTPVAMEPANCGFASARILSNNIGYLKLNSFPDPSICGAEAAAAMSSLNRADVVIFDLRDNHGGYPGMVMLIAAWLFDHPEYMYNPPEDMTESLWTRSPIPESRLADKPVYILTSGRTFSAAEHFSYDLKMLKRATLVGEATGGASDVGAFHRIDDHFGIGVRETRAVNPYSEPDWAVKGTQPDVKVNASDALVTAEKLAQLELRRK